MYVYVCVRVCVRVCVHVCVCVQMERESHTLGPALQAETRDDGEVPESAGRPEPSSHGQGEG